MKKILFSLILLLSISPCFAQGNPQCPTRPVGDSTNACASTAFVQQNGGSGLVVGTSAITGGTSGSFLFDNAGILGEVVGAGIPTNVLRSIITSDSILTTDCGKTLQLGTGTTGFFSLTIPAVAGFSTTCRVEVTNGDTARGKRLIATGNVPSNTPSILWPQQTITFGIVNGIWTVKEYPGRWRVPSGALTVNTDFTNGNDLTSDCLGTTTGACKSVEGALSLIQNFFDFTGLQNGTLVTVLMASGSTDTQGVHVAFHSWVGAQGGAAVKIDLNGGTMSNTSDVFQLYFGTVLQIRNGTLTSSGGCNILSNWGAKIYILDAVTFGAAVCDFTLDGPGVVEFENNFTITGAHTFHIINKTSKIRAGAAVTATIASNQTVTDWVLGVGPGNTDLSNITYSLGGNTCTGKKFDLTGNHVLQGTATFANCSVAGTTGTGGQAF